MSSAEIGIAQCVQRPIHFGVSGLDGESSIVDDRPNGLRTPATIQDQQRQIANVAQAAVHFRQQSQLFTVFPIAVATAERVGPSIESVALRLRFRRLDRPCFETSLRKTRILPRRRFM